MTAGLVECPVCTGDTTIPVHERADVPVFVNSLGRSAQEAITMPRGQLRLMGCRNCGFVWNDAFQPELMTYDLNYENDQAHSRLFAEHLRERAKDLVAMVPKDQPIDYLELGCGQGQFIELVAEAAGGRLKSAVGFDPAWRGEDGQGPGAAKIHQAFFNADTAHRLTRPPNIVASRHTIEHISNPVGFLKTVRSALSSFTAIPILLETPRVEWIFENEAIHDLFYEHCSLFSERSMHVALSRAGFDNIDIKPLFGGQYQWATARLSASQNNTPAETAEMSWMIGMDETYRDYVSRWTQDLQRAKEAGPVMIWGAGAKGVSFALMINAGHKLIDAAVDINPGKQGGFLPGSGLEVLSPEAAAKRGMATVLVMNPNYYNEVVATVRGLGLTANLKSL